MGGSNSVEITGVRVFKVIGGSPAAEAGLEVFFDFILEINGVKMDPQGQTRFAKVIQDAENGAAKLQVFNTRSHTTREVIIYPRKWAGTGLLGATVRYDMVDPHENHGVRVLEVFPNSPAAHSGLIPYQDFLLGTSSTVFHDIDELQEVVAANLNQKLQVYVYNTDSEGVREVTMAPNNEWGGEGCIGCDISTGLLHRIPPPRRMPGGMAPMSAPVGPPAVPGGQQFLPPAGVPQPSYPPGVQMPVPAQPGTMPVPGIPQAMPPQAVPGFMQPQAVPPPAMPPGVPAFTQPQAMPAPVPAYTAAPAPAAVPAVAAPTATMPATAPVAAVPAPMIPVVPPAVPTPAIPAPAPAVAMPAMIAAPQAPMAPMKLTEGIPTPEQIAHQKNGYAAALDKQLKEAITVIFTMHEWLEKIDNRKNAQQGVTPAEASKTLRSGLFKLKVGIVLSGFLLLLALMKLVMMTHCKYSMWNLTGCYCPRGEICHQKGAWWPVGNPMHRSGVF